MIHIERLDVQDFQTHKKTSIEFSPYFNVIVGSTRSGKSSLVRALDFLFYNNWYEDYLRIGSTNPAVITAKLSNGKVVVRTKSDRTNKVDVITGENKERFESFGLTLPNEVIAALGILPVDIGTKDPIMANIANQDDPLFLLYVTGTERTKILSRLSGLHWLDYALKDLNKDRRAASGDIQALQDTNVQLLVRLKDFDAISSFKARLAIERERLSKIKNIGSLAQAGSVLVTKTQLWKRDYQEVQSLKTIDFVKEIALLERVIKLQLDLLSPLQDLSRKLSTNVQSLKNISINLDSLNIDQENIRLQIEIESTKIPTCTTCGQELKQKV